MIHIERDLHWIVCIWLARLGKRRGRNEEISPNTHLYFPRILSQNQTFACGQVPRLVWGMQGSNSSNASPLFQRKQQQCMYTVAKIKVVICECCEEEEQTKFKFFLPD